MNVFLYFLYLFFLINIFNCAGNCVLKYLKYKYDFFISTLIGLSFLIIFLNFFYFELNLKITDIFKIVCISQLLIMFFSYKSLLGNLNKSYLDIFLIFISIIIFTTIAIIYGHQFYVFRGNHHDSSFYVGTAVVIEKYKYSELLSSINLSNSSLGNFLGTLATHIYERPGAALLLSFFILPHFLDVHLLTFIFKSFLISFSGLAFLRFISLFYLLNIINKIILYFFFTFSFWSLYIFEIDALSQLVFYPFFIAAIFFLFDVIDKNEINKKKILLLTIILSAAFIIYPQQIIILFLLIFVFLLIKLRFTNLINIFKKNSRLLLLCFFIFFIFTISHYEATYGDFKATIRIATANTDWWGYYGSFILGRESIVLDREVVEYIKKFYETNNNFFLTIQEIFYQNYNRGFFFIPTNIFVSFIGLYYLTPGHGLNFINSFLFLFSIYLIFFVYKNIFRNIVTILKFKNNNNIRAIFLSFLISFFIIFLFNLFNYGYWQMVKLYFFLSFLIIILIIFKFNSINKKIFVKLNYYLVILFLFFPFYKYSEFNHGIGRQDSFPSIIKIDLKKNFSWELDINSIKKCKLIKLNLENFDTFSHRYIYSKLFFYDIKISHSSFDLSDCEIKKGKDKFALISNN